MTGILYPILTWIVREMFYKVISPKRDEMAGIAATDDVEKGGYIHYVINVTAAVHLANKVSIAQLSSLPEFVGAVVLGLVIEVMSKAAVMCWFRNKVVAEDELMKSGILNVIGASSGEEQVAPRTGTRRHGGSLRRAVHRHNSGNSKKRYEFKTCNEQLGESVATGTAFGALMLSGDLQPTEGLARLAFALAIEYLSDLGVWSVLELDGCELVGARVASAIISNLTLSNLSTQTTRAMWFTVSCGGGSYLSCLSSFLR